MFHVLYNYFDMQKNTVTLNRRLLSRYSRYLYNFLSVFVVQPCSFHFREQARLYSKHYLRPRLLAHASQSGEDPNMSELPLPSVARSLSF